MKKIIASVVLTLCGVIAAATISDAVAAMLVSLAFMGTAALVAWRKEQNNV